MDIGIDLGTTNSLIACLDGGTPKCLPNAMGSLLTPSVVSLDGDTVLVGHPAYERLYTHPETTVASFKRLMGSQKETVLGNRGFGPEDLSCLILQSLKADAEAALGTAVTEATISVPAYFNDRQRRATRLAGEMAGLKVRRLINEPTAASMLHGIADRDADSRYLVFDLGGGTFDVSIVERFSGVMEVRATGGDSFLGGDDFTQTLADLVGRKAQAQDWNMPRRSRAAALRFAAERAKRELGSAGTVRLDLPPEARNRDVEVTLEEFEAACRPLIERLRVPVERALRDAQLRPDELEEIVLVGGATRMPMVRRLVTQLFGRLPARYPDPDQSIALGAAVCAGVISRNPAFGEVVLTDVCPHTLGIEVAAGDATGEKLEGLFLPIIERNTIVPASRVKTVGTAADYQEQVKVEVFQGESRFCSGNVFLDSLQIEVPPLKRGELAIDIRFTYDVSGILDVDVHVPTTAARHNLTINRASADLSDEQLAARRALLAELKVHPREQHQNRALIERANRLYEQRLGAERRAVADVLDEFTLVLNRQDPREIAKARAEFSAALDRVEGRSLW